MRLFRFMGMMNWGELQDYYAILSGSSMCKKSNLNKKLPMRKVIEADLSCHPRRTDSDSEAGGSRPDYDHAGPRDQSAAECAVDVSVYSPEGNRTGADQIRPDALTKAEGVISRIDAIIRSLRQFTRRAEPGTPLHTGRFTTNVQRCLGTLAMRHSHSKVR